MIAALVSETRKVLSTRFWWVLLIIMVAYMSLMAAAFAFIFSAAQVTGSDGQTITIPTEMIVRSVYTVSVSMGYVFPLIVGIMIVTTEYRHSTITPTFLAEPRRDIMVFSKLIVGAAMGLVYGLIATAATTAIGALILSILGKPTGLGEASSWQTLFLSAVALAAWCMVGVGLGMVVTSQFAAIAIAIAFTQLVEPTGRTLLVLTDWGKGIGPYLPGAAGEAISGGSVYSTMGLSNLLEHWWQGLLVLLAYAAVLTVIGRLTTIRKDVA